jgi:RHS repeat-associated protein
MHMLSTLPDEGVPAPLVPWSAEEVFSLAAGSQVNDRKPHQGVTGKKAGLYQGLAACNSTTALGVSWRQWSGTVPGARVTYEYDAYGNLLNSTGTTPNVNMYRGEAYDSDLGLYYLRARWMNPLTGRFLSRDPGKSRTVAPDVTRNDQNSDANQGVSFYIIGGPASTGPASTSMSSSTHSSTQGCSSSLSDEDHLLDPQAQHKYNYANGDPINLIDPSGRDAGIEVTLEDSEIEAAEEEGAKAGRCAVVKNLCWSGCFLAVTSAGIHGSDAFADTRACTRRCMAAAGCFNY